jgi:hypothetical protein
MLLENCRTSWSTQPGPSDGHAGRSGKRHGAMGQTGTRRAQEACCGCWGCVRRCDGMEPPSLLPCASRSTPVPSCTSSFACTPGPRATDDAGFPRTSTDCAVVIWQRAPPHLPGGFMRPHSSLRRPPRITVCTRGDAAAAEAVAVGGHDAQHRYRRPPLKRRITFFFLRASTSAFGGRLSVCLF